MTKKLSRELLDLYIFGIFISFPFLLEKSYIEIHNILSPPLEIIYQSPLIAIILFPILPQLYVFKFTYTLYHGIGYSIFWPIYLLPHLFYPETIKSYPYSDKSLPYNQTN